MHRICGAHAGATVAVELRGGCSSDGSGIYRIGSHGELAARGAPNDARRTVEGGCTVSPAETQPCCAASRCRIRTREQWAEGPTVLGSRDGVPVALPSAGDPTSRRALGMCWPEVSAAAPFSSATGANLPAPPTSITGGVVLSPGDAALPPAQSRPSGWR